MMKSLQKSILFLLKDLFHKSLQRDISSAIQTNSEDVYRVFMEYLKIAIFKKRIIFF